jgi:hypothetical protein
MIIKSIREVSFLYTEAIVVKKAVHFTSNGRVYKQINFFVLLIFVPDDGLIKKPKRVEHLGIKSIVFKKYTTSCVVGAGVYPSG